MEDNSREIQKAASQDLSIRQDKQREIFLEAAAKLLNKDIATRIVNASYEAKLSTIPLASEQEGVIDLIDIITQFRMMMGANKDHTSEQLQLEARYMQSSFGFLTIEDFRLGIQLFLDNKLDIDLPTYVNFSPLFISHIFNSYLRYRNKTMKEINILSDQKLLILDYDLDITRVQGLRECVEACYQHSQDEFRTERFFNSLVYDMLRKSKRMAFDDNLIKRAKKYAEKRFVEDRAANIAKEKEKVDAKPIGDELKSANPAKMYKDDRKKAEQVYARDFCLINYFKSINIDELLSSITTDDLE
jgi:hypothetical protein